MTPKREEQVIAGAKAMIDAVEKDPAEPVMSWREMSASEKHASIVAVDAAFKVREQQIVAALRARRDEVITMGERKTLGEAIEDIEAGRI